VVSASAAEAASPAAETAGDVSEVSIPAARAGGGADHPEPARLGPLLCCRRGEAGLWLWQRLGGKESPASSEACTETAGLRLAEVEEAVAGQAPGLVQGLPGAAPTTGAESAPSRRGPITLEVQRAGKRSAGKPHAAFDGAGAGNVATVALCTHLVIERAGRETLHLPQARLPSTLPESRGRKPCHFPDSAVPKKQYLAEK